jgi:hypothetical protein
VIATVEMDHLGRLVNRVMAEYREMPGLSLTTRQASRLWGMHPSVCEKVLEQLVLAGVLYNTRWGTYVAVPATRDEA